MKTLYERLSKEDKAKLEENLLEYPIITQDLIDSLKMEIGITRVKLQQAVDLLYILRPTIIFGVNAYITLFTN